MAFKRNNFSSLVNSKKEYFASTYKFSKKANFKEGSDVYIIPLGLESGFYETPCHRVQTHTVDKQKIGFAGSSFPVYIKCTGIDEEGNHDETALCCTLAKMEKDRFPDKNDSGKRIVSFATSRIHLPVLILGNSLADDTKASYPVSKVSILKDLKSEGGLKFSFLDTSASTFQQDIILAYGKKLKEDGILDYEMEEDTEEFISEVCNRLINTVIKVHGVTKQGFSAAMKEYSFFPFDNKAIACQSGEGEREAIINYKENKEIMQQISDFMTLFDQEVDGLVKSWTEKDLQEYYNSAIGADLKTPISAKEEKQEEVEIVSPKVQEKQEEDDLAPVGDVKPPISDDECDELIKDPFADLDEQLSEPSEPEAADETLNEIEFDAEDEDFV